MALLNNHWGLLLVLVLLGVANGFVVCQWKSHSRNSLLPRIALGASLNEKGDTYRREAEALRQKANELRSQIGESSQVGDAEATTLTAPMLSKWNVQEPDSSGEDYRLYVDIGREDGSWMDPRWASSGRRIEFSLDVRFTDIEATDDNRIVSDNIAGPKTRTKCLFSASHGRLNGGFNEMECHHGAYRVDQSKQGGTARFYVTVNGTVPKATTDAWIPDGDLQFSLPVFGRIAKLSAKEGIVSVRQVGWHTGWRRMESRIVGVFRAVRLADARARDGF